MNKKKIRMGVGIVTSRDERNQWDPTDKHRERDNKRHRSSGTRGHIKQEFKRGAAMNWCCYGNKNLEDSEEGSN